MVWYGNNLFAIKEIHNAYKQYLIKTLICLETTLRIQKGRCCYAYHLVNIKYVILVDCYNSNNQ